MRLKRVFCMVLVCAAAMGCLSVSAGAVEVMEREISTAIMRSTRQFSADIPGDTLLTDETDFSLEIGETITISATYTPRLHRAGRAVLFGQRKKRQRGQDHQGQSAGRLYAGDQE